MISILLKVNTRPRGEPNIKKSDTSKSRRWQQLWSLEQELLLRGKGAVNSLLQTLSSEGSPGCEYDLRYGRFVGATVDVTLDLGGNVLDLRETLAAPGSSASSLPLPSLIEINGFWREVSTGLEWCEWEGSVLSLGSVFCVASERSGILASLPKWLPHELVRQRASNPMIEPILSPIRHVWPLKPSPSSLFKNSLKAWLVAEITLETLSWYSWDETANSGRAPIGIASNVW